MYSKKLENLSPLGHSLPLRLDPENHDVEE